MLLIIFDSHRGEPLEAMNSLEALYIKNENTNINKTRVLLMLLMLWIRIQTECA